MGVWFALSFDFFAWLFVGLIIGAGDTKFFMYISSVSSWIFALLPMWVGYHFFDAGPTYGPLIFGVSTLGFALCFYARYRSGRWKDKAIV